MTQSFVQNFSEEIRRYCSFVNKPHAVENDELIELSAILSRLLSFGELCPDSSSNAEVDAPEHDREAILKIITARFPNFGYYNSCAPFEAPIGSCAVTVGDACDDVYDIYCDLAEALWYFDNSKPELGLWHAKLLIGHWGRHAIDLKSYLHEQIHEW